MEISIVVFIIFAVVLGAWLASINLLIKVGAAKGYAMENKGLLWFIGIFATPIIVGLYVAALPDNRLSAVGEEFSSAATEEIPES